jgi:hypothetical protein
MVLIDEWMHPKQRRPSGYSLRAMEAYFSKCQLEIKCLIKCLFGCLVFSSNYNLFKYPMNPH